MELFIGILIGTSFVLLCWMGAALVQQNNQLRKDLKDAYNKLNELKK